MAENRKSEKFDKVLGVRTPLDTKFFKMWADVTTPFHHLTDREKDILACLLKHRFMLQASITDEKLLNDILMGSDIRAKIRQECGVSTAFLQGILGKLKKNGVIIDGKINPMFIPHKLTKESKTFKLLILFDLNA